MLLDFRKPKCVVVKSCKSASGKYKLFYGFHYVKGKTCYDVGTINAQTGEIVSRHYLDNGQDNPKAEALRIYHDYEKALQRKAEVEEQDENSAKLTDEFRRALNFGRPGKPRRA